MKKIIVISKIQLAPIGVIRSLAKAGYSVDLLYFAAHKGDSRFVATTKYVGKVVEVSDNSEQKAVDALLYDFNVDGAKGVLFPVDDYSALMIDRNREKLRERFDMPCVIGSSIADRMDKSVQSQLAKSNGLKTAKEWVVSLDSDSIIIPDDVVFPCFVKPAVSALGGKSELKKCEDLKELRDQLVKMQNREKKRSVLVQEYLNIQKEYDIGGVCNDWQVFIPAVIRKDIVAQHNCGVTLKGTVVDKNEISENLPRLVSFLQSVRYVGMFDLEIMVTDNGLYFGELNLRSGGPSYSYFLCGVNLPDLAVNAVLQKSIDISSIQIEYNRSFYNNITTWQDYLDGYLTKTDLRRIQNTCDYSILTCDDDPAPERVFNLIKKPLYLIKSRAKRLLRR